MKGSHSGRSDRLLLGFLVVAALWFGAAPAQGQFFTQASDTPQVIASATGEAPVRPDRAIVYVTLVARDSAGPGGDSGHGGYT